MRRQRPLLRLQVLVRPSEVGEVLLDLVVAQVLVGMGIYRLSSIAFAVGSVSSIFSGSFSHRVIQSAS